MGFWQRFSVFPALRSWLSYLEDLQEDSAPFLSIFLELLCLSWRPSVFVGGGFLGAIFGGGPFASRFLGFVRSSEYR